MTHANDKVTLETLEARLTSLLPQEYQGAYEDVEPTPMGSAALKFDADGKVVWNEIWQTFCDLAMAGGPPHKGALLRPGTPAEIAADPDRYTSVVDEICRGIAMATNLPAEISPEPGWVHVGCDSDGMAAWLLRAITMENVSVRADGAVLDLPAAPGYRLDKEIKNVVTVVAKTCHYWSGHMWRFEQRDIANLFAELARESPLIVPAPDADPDWIGVECANVRDAVWMMRMMVASNVLARREETRLFVPVNADIDPGGAIVAATVARLRRFASERAAR